VTEHYAPEDANVPVTMTLAAHYEGIREAQAEAWDAGAEAQAKCYGMDKDTGPNPYRSQQ